ncbi:hypothetical protein GCM10022393_32010 [Aquimarina addita]|uniref:DUF748 domain-containing protein n=1 Tax=Aquimarina addita TaxID=870485 RepID=A0ABP6URA6_9FLAO
MSTKRKIYKKKRYIIPVFIILTLLVIRIMLPTIVKKYVNQVLADIPGYYGQIESIDIGLIRGAYVINGLYLNKVNAGTQVPFINLAETDISIEWKSIFKGKIVSEIILKKPEIIYVFEDQQKETENEAEVEDWTKALTDLVPIEINTLTIYNGKIAFVEVTAEPTIDLHLNGIELTATNLRNVVEKEQKLPSTLQATATSIGNGSVKLDGKLNLLKQIPDMDISFALENANAKALNDFTNHYAGIDFDKGNFNLYSEIAIADSYMKGYMKPLLKDAKLIGKDDGFLKTLWEGFVGFFKFILKNQKNNTLATKVPLEGDLSNVKTKIWPSITNIFKNAWIQAFKNVVDDDIEFEDIKSSEKSK